MGTNPSELSLNLADSMAQQPAPPLFAMHGSREILSLTAGAVHIEQQIKAIEDAVANSPSLAFDYAKALIESACKTILRDRGQEVPTKDDLPKLFGTTLDQLRVLPHAHAADADTGRSIRKTAGALHSVVQGICELRNRQGSASHGKLAETLPLESVQAELAARSADAVVSFLFKVHRSYGLPPSKPTRVQYAGNDGFNTFIDESHDTISILGLTYRPSEVLYSVDYQAYVDALNSHLSSEADEAAGTQPPEVSD